MNLKLIGAVIVVISCGGFGFSIAGAYRREEKMYLVLLRLLQNMRCELQYHLTSLPDLCRQSGEEIGGIIGKVFSDLSSELQTQQLPDAASCMRTVLNKEDLPITVKKILFDLGNILGRFDLDGQIQGLDAITMQCEFALQNLSNHRDERLRGYQTLGLCAGAALVIIFI